MISEELTSCLFFAGQGAVITAKMNPQEEKVKIITEVSVCSDVSKGMCVCVCVYYTHVTCVCE